MSGADTSGVSPPPGDPAELHDAAAAYRRRSRALGAELTRLQRAGRADWVGAAATDYAAALHRSADRVRRLADRHEAAASVLDEHATVLAEAQRRGAGLVEQAESAARRGDTADLARLRRAAEQLRDETDHAAERAARRLAAVTPATPATRDRSGAGAQAAASDRRADLRRIYRRRLHRDDSRFARRMVRQLEGVPAVYHRRVARMMRNTDQGGIYVGHRPITELGYPSSNFDQPPRGWPPGSTWADVPGVFDPAGPALLLGTGAHGSTNLALHEFGHAADAALGDPSQGQVFRRLHARIADRVTLDPYYTQPGGVGQQELFAEAFAWRYEAGNHETFQGSKAAATMLRRYFDRLEGSL